MSVQVCMSESKTEGGTETEEPGYRTPSCDPFCSTKKGLQGRCLVSYEPGRELTQAADQNFQGLKDKTELCHHPSPSPTPREAFIWYLVLRPVHMMSTPLVQALRRWTGKVSAFWSLQCGKEMSPDQESKDRCTQCLYLH